MTLKLLYGLFYTSFSLAVVSAFALVVVLLIRFIIVKVPKKYFMCVVAFFDKEHMSGVIVKYIFTVTRNK